ncbi:MAG: hypothetical protein IPP94_18195 [Ignavibacteria bacterium]|nr:hypothetical protein [Ignavibacteria bacterium]
MKKQTRKNPAESDRRAASHASDPGLQRALLLACVAYAVLRVAASFAGGGLTRVWGIDYASYLIARPDILLALALPFLALLPGVERRVAAWLTKPATGRFQRLHGLIAAMCIVAAGGIVASFSIPFPYLGDAPYYLGDTFRAVQQTGRRRA